MEYKTNKAALLHFFMNSVQGDMPHLKGSLHTIHDKALFHALINISPTFGEMYLKLLVHVVAKSESQLILTMLILSKLRSTQCPATSKPSDFKLSCSWQMNGLNSTLQTSTLDVKQQSSSTLH